MFDAKPDNLSSVPGTLTGEEEKWILQVVLRPLQCVLWHMHAHTCPHRQKRLFKNFGHHQKVIYWCLFSMYYGSNLGLVCASQVLYH